MTASILLVTAAGKIAGLLLGRLPSGVEPPLPGLSPRLFVLAVALVELALAVAVLRSRWRSLAAAGVAVWAAAAMGYRLLWLPPQSPCPCPGGWETGVAFLDAHLEEILRVSLLWMLLSSIGILLWQARGGPAPSGPEQA